ncbi:MAG: serine dehydratase subunit alpha family protein [Deltaproteobacteria bacterium]|nr:serine dehydratase subunit alpha family protein [Deltaproteobacteria bacterium]
MSSDLGALLMRSTVPVTGCTEPAAVALATSLAAAVARGEIPAWAGAAAAPPAPAGEERIELVDLRTVRSLYKNVVAVGIPNAGTRTGIDLAAALGPSLDCGERLALLAAVGPEVLRAARGLLADGVVAIQVQEAHEDVLFLEARVVLTRGGERHVGEVVIRGEHDAVHLVRRDGRPLRTATTGGGSGTTASGVTAPDPARWTIAELIAAARTLSPEVRAHLLRGVAINRAAAEAGRTRRLGAGVGAMLAGLADRGRLARDVTLDAKIAAASAADARMSGHGIEVMSSAGSGNQGIVVTLPVAAVAEFVGADDDRLAAALALGHGLTARMTHHTGVLAALCGCVVKAGIGAAAGAALLLDPTAKAVPPAVQNMAGNITGEICDGAKVGCAFKIATAAGAALESALLAHEGVSIPPSNGILGPDADATLANIGEIARSMRDVDCATVRILERKRAVVGY